MTKQEIDDLLKNANWDEIIPELGKSLTDLYDYDYPDFIGAVVDDGESYLDPEYLFDPDIWGEKHGMPTFAEYLQEKLFHVEHFTMNGRR